MVLLTDWCITLPGFPLRVVEHPSASGSATERRLSAAPALGHAGRKDL